MMIVHNKCAKAPDTIYRCDELTADLARVTEERDRLLERNKTLAEMAMRATARANGQEVEVEKGLAFIRDILEERNRLSADNARLREAVGSLQNRHNKVRGAIGAISNAADGIENEVFMEFQGEVPRTICRKLDGLEESIAAAEAALKGDS